MDEWVANSITYKPFYGRHTHIVLLSDRDGALNDGAVAHVRIKASHFPTVTERKKGLIIAECPLAAKSRLVFT